MDAAVDARRAGAVVFEKHVTLDRTQPGPDHSFAMEMAEFADYVGALKATPVDAVPADGPFLPPPQVEWRNRALALKSIILRRALPAGHAISAEDVYMARPGTGLSPAALPHVVGCRLARALEAEVPLQWDDLKAAGHG